MVAKIPSLKSILLALIAGGITSWLIKEEITPILLGGKNFESRSIFVQIGILISLMVLNSLLFLGIIALSRRFLAGKFEALVQKIQLPAKKAFSLWQMPIKPFSKPDLLMLLIVFIWGLGNLLLGEIVPVTNGFGWDGSKYRRITRNFPEQVFEKKLDSYSVQRIVPSGIVYYGLSALQLPLNNENILLGFQILDLAAIVLAVYVYILITRELNFNTKSKWLGFVGLFVNFVNAKHYFYYPVLTDQLAFLLGMLMLFYFIKSNQPGLLLTTIIGSFTWPLFMVYGWLLYTFPNKGQKFKTRNILTGILTTLTALALLIFIIWVYFVNKVPIPNGTWQVVNSTVIYSIVCTLSYIFFGLKIALDNIGIPDMRTLIKSTSVGRFFIGLLMLSFIKALSGFLTDIPPSLSALYYLELIVLESIVRPFGFVISHVVYFGPILLLTVILWKPYSQIVSNYGLGLSLLAISSFFLSAGTESRHLVPSLPFLVLFTVKATEELKWKPSVYWLIGIISFAFSKVWFHINSEPLTGDFLQFPWQRFFMNYGPWMSNQMYILQGSAVLVTGIMLFLLLKKAQVGDKIAQL